MVNKSLVDYISQGLKKGYSINSLRNYLVQQGYNAAEVDLAAKQANPSNQSKKFIIFFVVLIMIAMISISIIVLNMPDKKTSIPSRNNLNQNQLGDSTNNVDVSQNTQNRNIDSDQNNRVSRTSTPPTNNNKNTDTTTNNKNKFNETNSKTVNIVIENNNNNNDEETFEIRSINDCDNFEKEDSRDDCILEFSWEKDHMTFCDKIDSDKTKDECYSRYALRHEDKELCNRISSQYSRQICSYFLLVTDKLKELDVEYTIDAKKPTLIYDQELAQKKLLETIKENENQMQEQLDKRMPGSSTFESENTNQKNNVSQIIQAIPENHTNTSS